MFKMILPKNPLDAEECRLVSAVNEATTNDLEGRKNKVIEGDTWVMLERYDTCNHGVAQEALEAYYKQQDSKKNYIDRQPSYQEEMSTTKVSKKVQHSHWLDWTKFGCW
jgi:hypothetical protein